MTVRKFALLIQDPESPRALMTIQSLNGEGFAWQRMSHEAELLPDETGPRFVIWDLHGFSGDEQEALAHEMAGARAGVVVLSGPEDDAGQATIQTCRALSGAVAPRNAGELATSLCLGYAAHQKLAALMLEGDQLQKDYDGRLVVEQAKDYLRRSRGWSDGEALSRMRKKARDGNRKLAQVAREVLAGSTLFADPDDNR